MSKSLSSYGESQALEYAKKKQQQMEKAKQIRENRPTPNMNREQHEPRSRSINEEPGFSSAPAFVNNSMNSSFANDDEFTSPTKRSAGRRQFPSGDQGPNVTYAPPTQDKPAQRRTTKLDEPIQTFRGAPVQDSYQPSTRPILPWEVGSLVITTQHLKQAIEEDIITKSQASQLWDLISNDQSRAPPPPQSNTSTPKSNSKPDIRRLNDRVVLDYDDSEDMPTRESTAMQRKNSVGIDNNRTRDMRAEVPRDTRSEMRVELSREAKIESTEDMPIKSKGKYIIPEEGLEDRPVGKDNRRFNADRAPQREAPMQRDEREDWRASSPKPGISANGKSQPEKAYNQGNQAPNLNQIRQEESMEQRKQQLTKQQQLEIEAQQAQRMKLVECDYCGKRFRQDRIEKHSDICARQSERPTYDSAAHRMDGEAAYLMKKNERKTAELENKEKKEMPKWKRDHLQLQRAMAQMKGGPGKIEQQEAAEDRVSCPHCARKFAPEVAERHIPKCKNIINKPGAPIKAPPPERVPAAPMRSAPTQQAPAQLQQTTRMNAASYGQQPSGMSSPTHGHPHAASHAASNHSHGMQSLNVPQSGHSKSPSPLPTSTSINNLYGSAPQYSHSHAPQVQPQSTAPQSHHTGHSHSAHSAPVHSSMAQGQSYYTRDTYSPTPTQNVTRPQVASAAQQPMYQSYQGGQSNSSGGQHLQHVRSTGNVSSAGAPSNHGMQHQMPSHHQASSHHHLSAGQGHAVHSHASAQGYQQAAPQYAAQRTPVQGQVYRR